jgi:hypothetical protein
VAQICPHCRTDDVQTLMRGIQCLNSKCGKLTSYEQLNKPKAPKG